MDEFTTTAIKTATKSDAAFKLNFIRAVNNAISVIKTEDISTENHLRRYAFAILLQEVFGNSYGFDDAIIDNQSITYNSTQEAFNAAVLAEWDNIANKF